MPTLSIVTLFQRYTHVFYSSTLFLSFMFLSFFLLSPTFSFIFIHSFHSHFLVFECFLFLYVVFFALFSLSLQLPLFLSNFNFLLSPTFSITFHLRLSYTYLLYSEIHEVLVSLSFFGSLCSLISFLDTFFAIHILISFDSIHYSLITPIQSFRLKLFFQILSFFVLKFTLTLFFLSHLKPTW